MTAVSAKASGPSAAAAPASVRSCSWSPLSPPNTTRPLQSSATDCSPLEKKKWSSESLSPTNCSSASTQKHAMRVHNTPMQLDTSDSRSPQRSPREERGEGEVIDRPSCLNLNSSRFRGRGAHKVDYARHEKARDGPGFLLLTSERNCQRPNIPPTMPPMKRPPPPLWLSRRAGLSLESSLELVVVVATISVSSALCCNLLR